MHGQLQALVQIDKQIFVAVARGHLQHDLVARMLNEPFSDELPDGLCRFALAGKVGVGGREEGGVDVSDVESGCVSEDV